MDSLHFMRAALAWLSEAQHFQRLMALTLRVAAALLVPLSLVTFFKAGKTIFDLPASGILGGIVFQIFFVAAVYGVVQVLFLRAREIEALPVVRYYMFPLASVFLRAAGEVASLFIACLAVGGGVYVWFTARAITTLLNPPPNFLPVFGDTTFMGGIEFMAGGVLSAVVLLGATYLVAQTLALVGELATRTEPKRDAQHTPQRASGSHSGYRLRSGTDD